ncbi:acyl-CoA dehydrogenase family protein [Hephaestia sp. GCM10023244]|uniref:acyl-CoA dehydrogenase family protein n=1 Tax=unclassified Hephaestia TaxID=2631281 RepID=UPI0020777D0B|nr:acyl-CoA dehydrogenase family protein [Hephaestia sp. MAHUQ-44]
MARFVDQTYLEWPFFEDHHRRLAVELEEWCRTELAAHSPDERDIDGACRRLVAALAAGGWLRYVAPAAYGGIFDELDVRSLCIIRQILAFHSGLADFAFAMQGLGSGTISLAGSDAQKQAYLPAVVRGDKIAAFAMTEAHSGSDVANMETRAELREGRYRINGEKTFISNGGIADFYVLFARTGEAPGAKGVSAFVIDADAPGLEIVERIEVIAPHPLARIGFQDCVLEQDALIGEAGRGFANAMTTLDIFRSTVGAAALGFSRRALHEATGRAQSRHLFGASLASNPITQSRLAEMVAEVDASALLIYRAAWTHDVARRENSREAAIAKLHATEAAQGVIDKAVQMFGGLGVVKGEPVESLYREIRALRIYEGASEVQKVVIARRHLRG